MTAQALMDVASSDWQTVSVVGVGLIGGSFALALRKAGFTGEIIGVSSPRTIAAALERKVIDRSLPLAEAAGQSDAIFLAQPIAQILETLDVIDQHVRPGTLITDAGSTKRQIVKRAAQQIRRGRFVGGHPMAGKEARGVEAADAELFRGRPWVLTGSSNADEQVLSNWIRKFGARLVTLDAMEHDRLVALVSHVPQLMSTALGLMIDESGEAAKVAGPAALDLTRLALSPYDIWRDILATNANEIDQALGAYIKRLTQLRRQLHNIAGESVMEQEFARAARGAQTLRGGPTES